MIEVAESGARLWPTASSRCALAFALAGLLTLGACVSEDAAGEGEVMFVLAGGEALRDGFPHFEGTTEMAFVDGWSLTFDKYVVCIEEISLRRPTGGEPIVWRGGAVVDLARQPSRQREIANLQAVPALRHDVGFITGPPAASPEVVDAESADVADMRQNGWAMLIAGTAQKGAEQRRFRVGLPASARYTRCANGADGTQGLAVQSQKTTQAVINTHAVHLFWDSLVGETAALRFDAWAGSVESGEGPADVSWQSLAGQDLFNLKGPGGGPLLGSKGGPVLYNDGGLLPSGQTHLAAFVNEGARISLHFNGLGFCEYDAPQ